VRLEQELEKLGMKKIDLARELGVQPGTVYRWTDDSTPAYVWAYLKLKGMSA
jgi:hypothetical protein